MLVKLCKSRTMSSCAELYFGKEQKIGHWLFSSMPVSILWFFSIKQKLLLSLIVRTIAPFLYYIPREGLHWLKTKAEFSNKLWFGLTSDQSAAIHLQYLLIALLFVGGGSCRPYIYPILGSYLHATPPLFLHHEGQPCE